MIEIAISDVLDAAPPLADGDLRAIARDIGFLLAGIAAGQVTTDEVRAALRVLSWRLERLVDPIRWSGSSH